MAGEIGKIKKIKKKAKNFIWKLKWVPVPNSVQHSQPLFVRRWVKIKLEKPQVEELESQEDELVQKPNGNMRDIAAQIIDDNQKVERKGASEWCHIANWSIEHYIWEWSARCAMTSMIPTKKCPGISTVAIQSAKSAWLSSMRKRDFWTALLAGLNMTPRSSPICLLKITSHYS